MSIQPQTLNEIEKVGKIVDLLKSNQHNGFPVIDSTGRLAGMMSRNNLILMMKYKIFYKESELEEIEGSMDQDPL
jgi:predicted transcriptional regulator